MHSVHIKTDLLRHWSLSEEHIKPVRLPLPTTNAVRRALPALPKDAESLVRGRMSGRSSARCHSALLLNRSKCQISTANARCAGVSHPGSLCSQSLRSTQTCSPVLLKKKVKMCCGACLKEPILQGAPSCRALEEGRATHALRVTETWGLSSPLGCEVARGFSTLLAQDQPSGSPLLRHSGTVGRAQPFIKGDRCCFEDKWL